MRRLYGPREAAKGGAGGGLGSGGLGERWLRSQACGKVPKDIE